MTRHFLVLAAASLSLLITGCAHQMDKADRLPKNAEYVPAPMFDQFDPAQVTADAQKLLGTQGPVSMMTLNVKADKKDLPEIIRGLKGIHERGEPVVCVGRDSRFVTDALGRALEKYPKTDLSGLSIVIAAPNEPTKEFPEFLARYKIEYHYLHVKSAGPYGQ